MSPSAPTARDSRYPVRVNSCCAGAWPSTASLITRLRGPRVLAKIAVLPSGVTVRWGHAAAGHQIAEVGVKQVQLTGLEVHDIKVQSCSRGLVSHSYAGNKR